MYIMTKITEKDIHFSEDIKKLTGITGMVIDREHKQITVTDEDYSLVELAARTLRKPNKNNPNY